MNAVRTTEIDVNLQRACVHEAGHFCVAYKYRQAFAQPDWPLRA